VRGFVTLAGTLVALLLATANGGPSSAAGRGCADLRAPRFRVAPRFLAPGSTGLWSPPNSRCLLRVSAGSESVEVVLRLRRRERLVGLHWAPDGRSFVAVSRQPRRVFLLGAGGRLLRKWSARTAAFVADGRLVLAFDSGVYVTRGRRLRRIATSGRLKQAAGFRSAAGPFGPDPWGSSRGYGANAVAFQWWSGRRDALLVVDTAGRVSRVSPNGRGFVSVGGSAWAPKGRRLLEFTVFPSPPGFEKEHDHCLHVWSDRGGSRQAFCVSALGRRFQFHFDKLLWARDGRTALLNDGTVISTSGRVLGLARGAGDPAFGILWRPG
jgi:hypothetical protein